MRDEMARPVSGQAACSVGGGGSATDETPLLLAQQVNYSERRPG
jgi:hypothetical protein